MREKRYNRFFQIAAAVICFAVLFSSCKDKVNEGLIIFTQTPAKENKIDTFTGNSLKNVPQSKIVSFDSIQNGE